MTFRLSIGYAVLPALILAAGCVSMPDFDRNADLPPEFQEEFGEEGRIPFTTHVPPQPDALKTSAKWDLDARAVLNLRDEFDLIESIPASTPQQIMAKHAALHARVNAYILDDPE